MGHRIHVYSVYVSPCDDPEIQMVVSIGSVTHSLTIICPYEWEAYDETHHFPHPHGSPFILEDFFPPDYLLSFPLDP